MHQRIGWFVLKTQRPPGRSTRATSVITAALSVTNGMAPNAEQARSTLASREGERGRRRPAPARAPRPGSCCSGALGRGAAGRRKGRRRPPRRPVRRASARTGPPRSPTSRMRRPRSESRRSEQPGRLLAQALGTPDEVRGGRIARRSGQELAVLGLVGVGLVVPPGAVGRRSGRAGLPPRSRR